MGAPAMRDFRYGRLAPSFYGRADLGLYAAGLKEARNVYVKRMGGLTSRPGTLYKGTTKSNGAVVLVDAVFDTTENFMLEFGNLYVRFWKDGELVTVGTPAAWVTSTAYVVGDIRVNSGTNYYCLVAHTSGTFATDLAAGKWYALTSDILEIPTDYTTAQLSGLQFAAQYRVVTIVHPSHPPATLTKGATDTAWVLADIGFALSGDVPGSFAVSGSTGTGWGYSVAAFYSGVATPGPATPWIYTDTTSAGNTFAYAIARAASPRTITWTAPAGHTNNAYVLYIRQGTSGTIYGIAVTGTSYSDNGTGFYGATTSTPYTESSNFFDAAGEYPAVVGAYQQRLLLSGSDDQPDVVYASQSAEPYNFYESDPIVDSDGLNWRQVGQRLNRVRFFAEVAQRLVQFSSVGESIIQGDTDGILRPGEVNPRLVSQNGISESVPPLVVGDVILYVQARGNQVMDMWPDGTGSEISRAAWDLLDGFEIVSWCFQRTPDRVVWAVRDDGKLLSLTYSQEDEIVGWAWHDTDGEFERVVCVPEGDEDAVYAVVNRTIDGGTVRYVERFADRLADVPVLMDSAKVALAPVPASLTRATAGLQAFHVRTADVVSGVSEAFDLADWTGQNLGSGGLTLAGNGDLEFNKNGVSGLHWARYTPVSFDANGVVMASIASASTGAGIGVGARFSTETPPQESVIASIPVGFSGNYTLSDTTGGGASGSSTDGPANRATSDIDRILLSVEGTQAEARLQTVNGSSGNSDPTLTLSSIGASGDFSGVHSSSGTAGSLTVTYRQFAVLRGRALTVNGPTTGNWRIRLKNAANSVILTSAVQTGGVATLDLLDNRDTWLGSSAASLLSLATQIEIYDDDAAAVVVGPETPTTRLWGGDVWTFTGATGFDGLGHLEGEAVSVVTMDGEVLASPYNSAYDTITVTDGSITLPDGTDDVYVGLPYVTDIQTLDIETVNGTRKDAGILVNKIGLWLEDTLGLSARADAPTSDTSLDGFQSLPVVDENGNTTTDPVTGYREVSIDGVWTRGGSIFLRNVDPTPVTIHSISPQGTFGRS